MNSGICKAFIIQKTQHMNKAKYLNINLTGTTLKLFSRLVV